MGQVRTREELYYGHFGGEQCAVGEHDLTQPVWENADIEIVGGVNTHAHLGYRGCKRNCGWFFTIGGEDGKGLRFRATQCPIEALQAEEAAAQEAQEPQQVP